MRGNEPRAAKPQRRALATARQQHGNVQRALAAPQQALTAPQQALAGPAEPEDKGGPSLVWPHVAHNPHPQGCHVLRVQRTSSIPTTPTYPLHSNDSWTYPLHVNASNNHREWPAPLRHPLSEALFDEFLMMHEEQEWC